MSMLEIKQKIIAVACCMSDEVGYPTGTPNEGYEDIPFALEELVAEGELVFVGTEERGGKEWAIYRLPRRGETPVARHRREPIPGTDLPARVT